MPLAPIDQRSNSVVHECLHTSLSFQPHSHEARHGGRHTFTNPGTQSIIRGELQRGH